MWSVSLRYCVAALYGVVYAHLCTTVVVTTLWLMCSEQSGVVPDSWHG